MMSSSGSQFQDFFMDDTYVLIKNDLYSYLLRKRAVGKALRDEKLQYVLEIGSGLSPLVSHGGLIVYTDLSLLALQILKSKEYRECFFLVADCTNLPFKDRSFTQVVCSEVLEHVQDDQKALQEMTRMLKPSGSLVLTFPHRRFYFSLDDRYVHHLRRYELSEMLSCIGTAGLQPVLSWKVLGPLEKITMLAAVSLYAWLKRSSLKPYKITSKRTWPHIYVVIFRWFNKMYCVLARMDAIIMPRFLSTVLLIKAVKPRK
jgi:SAM-dependent methyltransferase